MALNPYEVLGVNPSMSKDDIKNVYRKLAKKYHPDGSHGDANKFMEIQKAWKQIEKLGSNAFNRYIGKPTHITLFTFRRI